MQFISSLTFLYYIAKIAVLGLTCADQVPNYTQDSSFPPSGAVNFDLLASTPQNVPFPAPTLTPTCQTIAWVIESHPAGADMVTTYPTVFALDAVQLTLTHTATKDDPADFSTRLALAT